MKAGYIVEAKDGVLRWCPTCGAQRTIYVVYAPSDFKVLVCCASCQRVHASFPSVES